MFSQGSRQARVQTMTYLWVVFGITGVQGNGLEIEPAVKIDGGDNVP